MYANKDEVSENFSYLNKKRKGDVGFVNISESESLGILKRKFILKDQATSNMKIKKILNN